MKKMLKKSTNPLWKSRGAIAVSKEEINIACRSLLRGAINRTGADEEIGNVLYELLRKGAE